MESEVNIILIRTSPNHAIYFFLHSSTCTNDPEYITKAGIKNISSGLMGSSFLNPRSEHQVPRHTHKANTNQHAGPSIKPYGAKPSHRFISYGA